MKKQKVISMLLVVAMMLAMSATVFADGDTTEAVKADAEGKATIQVTSTCNLPNIDVTFGEPGAIVANPYQMTFKGPDNNNTSASLASTASYIQSNSTVRMDIKATPTAAPPTGVTISTDDFDEGVTGDKKMMLVMTIDTVAAVGPAGKTAALAFNGSNGEKTTSAAKVTVGDSVTPSATIRMAAAADKTDANATYAGLLMSGKTAGANWKDSDKVVLTIAFEITPVLATAT